MRHSKTSPTKAPPSRSPKIRSVTRRCRPNVLVHPPGAGSDMQCRRVADKLSQLTAEQRGVCLVAQGRRSDPRQDREHDRRRPRSHVWIKAAQPAGRPSRRRCCAPPERGVQVVLILFGDPEAPADYPLDPPSRDLHARRQRPRGRPRQYADHGDAIDFEEALTVNTAEGGFGAHTRNLPVVNIAESLIRHEIYLAEIFARFGRRSKRRSGRRWCRCAGTICQRRKRARSMIF